LGVGNRVQGGGTVKRLSQEGFVLLLVGAWMWACVARVIIDNRAAHLKPGVFTIQTGCYEPTTIKVYNDDLGNTTISGTVVPCKGEK